MNGHTFTIIYIFVIGLFSLQTNIFVLEKKIKNLEEENIKFKEEYNKYICATPMQKLFASGGNVCIRSYVPLS
jgi:hypothetical protein